LQDLLLEHGPQLGETAKFDLVHGVGDLRPIHEAIELAVVVMSVVQKTHRYATRLESCGPCGDALKGLDQGREPLLDSHGPAVVYSTPSD